MTAIINSCLVLLYTAVGYAVQQPTGQHVSKEVFFYGATAAYQKSQSAVFMLPKKVSLQLSSEQCIGCQDYAAELEERSTGKVPRLQKFCLNNC